MLRAQTTIERVKIYYKTLEILKDVLKQNLQTMTLEMDEINQIEEKIINVAGSLEELIMKSHDIPHKIWSDSIILISKCYSNIDTKKYRVFNTKKIKKATNQNMDLTERAIRLLNQLIHCLPPIQSSELVRIQLPQDMVQDFEQITNAFSQGYLFEEEKRNGLEGPLDIRENANSGQKGLEEDKNSAVETINVVRSAVPRSKQIQ